MGIQSVAWLASSMLALLPALGQSYPASLTGTLRGPNGVGVAKAIVVIESASRGRRYDYTSPGGQFHFAELQPGAYTLRVGFDHGAVFDARVDLKAGEQKSLPPLTLPVGVYGDCNPNRESPEKTRFDTDQTFHGGLAGKVQGASGPAIGARVMLLSCPLECTVSRAARTDLHGDFEFEDLTPGSYALMIEQPGFFPAGNVRFVVAGGAESTYLFQLIGCPNGDCFVKGPVKMTTCD